jgi:5-methylcytosine-specific restriction endonuclease McrA
MTVISHGSHLRITPAVEHVYDYSMDSRADEFQLEERLAEVAGALNVHHADLVLLAARAQRDGGWIGEGIHSLPHWLTIHLGVSPGHARQIATIADRVEDFPILIGAFRRGELSLDQVYEVAARAPAWADRHVTDFALVATVRQLRRMIRDEHFDHDPDAPREPSRTAQAGISPTWDEHGRFRISGSLDADDGRLVAGAFDEARDALFRAGHTDVTWNDALAEIARRSLAGVADDRGQRFLPQVHLHTDVGAAQLTNGVPLPPAIRDHLLCDSALIPVWERDRVAFGAGRSQRAVPDRLRRIVEHRDQGCRVPACGSRHAEIHHIVPWSEGGLTESWNLMCLCRRHHKLLHLGKLGVRGNADVGRGLVFTDERGCDLVSHPAPVPPVNAPPRPAVRYEHPSGGALQRAWTGLGWAHPNALAKRREQLIEHHRAGSALVAEPSDDANQATAS